MEELRIRWAKNLAAARAVSGSSQQEVADSIGVSQQAVSFWERGERIPDVASQIALGRLFGVEPRDLFPLEDVAS
jgi:transcriptional regulator with XRE-family HTH domain